MGPVALNAAGICAEQTARGCVIFAPLVPIIFAKLERVPKIRLYKIGHWNSPRAGRRAAVARSFRGRPDPCGFLGVQAVRGPRGLIEARWGRGWLCSILNRLAPRSRGIRICALGGTP